MAKWKLPIWASVTWRLLLSAIVPAIGVQISVDRGDWTWFARSGSLMVAQSICFFALAYFSDSTTVANDFLRELLGVGEIDDRDDLPDTMKERISDKVWRDMSPDAKIDRLTHSAVSYFTAAIWAVLGTLVWGFGDLVGVWFD